MWLALEILQYFGDATRFLNKEINTSSAPSGTHLFSVRNNINAELLFDELCFETVLVVATARSVREDCCTCSKFELARAQTCLIRKSRVSTPSA